jgi:hypothetical protein
LIRFVTLLVRIIDTGTLPAALLLVLVLSSHDLIPFWLPFAPIPDRSQPKN